MMYMLLRILCQVGIGDGIWVATKPKAWGKTWSNVIQLIENNRLLALLAGGFEVLLCSWILKQLNKKK